MIIYEFGLINTNVYFNTLLIKFELWLYYNVVIGLYRVNCDIIWFCFAQTMLLTISNI